MKMAKVKVQQGWLEGEILESSADKRQFYSFKGIPYATPPVGKLRFKAPQLPQPWDGVRQAKAHGPTCPQKNLFSNEIMYGNEDCLYLNVYTPNLEPSAPLAVMVFIHGGGFKCGSGNDDNYGPDFLMSHNVVLVTINYRLDAFGFLCIDTEDVPGNAGLKDQVLAFKWVKDNIANFGGDPDNITIIGESAGGASCTLHLMSPLSKGLFKRSIIMSGVAFNDWAIPFEAKKRAFTLGKQLGLDTKDPNALLDFLQSLPAEKLISRSPFVRSSEEIEENIIKLYHFTPVVEKDFGGSHFITKNPFDILKSGKINDVDVLIGYTSMEGLFSLKTIESDLISDYNKYQELFVPRKILLQANPSKILDIADRIHKKYFGEKLISLDTIKEFVDYASHSCFTYDVYRFIKLLAKTGNHKRYMYKFSTISDRNVYGRLGQKFGIIGTSHLDDLMYLFDAKQANLKLNLKEYNMVMFVCSLFTNFAKYGLMVTDDSDVVWPEYGEGEFYGDITDKVTIGQHLDADVNQFWKEIYDLAGIEFV